MNRSKDQFLVFGSPAIEDAEIQEVIASMKTGWLGTGPKVTRFEQDFCAYKGGKHAIAVNSCTAALHLSLLAANLRPGDEVITTPLTFCATVNAIIHAGGTPVLADVNPVTMNIDPEQIEAKITHRTKAIIPVHFAGRPCDMDALCELAQRHGIFLIEDCAHAIETQYKGRPAGTFGDFGCFSFYVTKNITTGEGGMILTQTQAQADRIKVLALHGMSQDAWKRFSDEGYNHYEVVEAGFKYNMMDIQAAIGIHQLQRVTPYWRRRQEIWQQYDRAFASLPVVTPAAPEPNTVHGYHLYTLLIDEQKTGISRDGFLVAMHQQHIGTGVHYRSLPEYPYYQQRFGWQPSDYPHAAQIGRQTVSIPLSAKLTPKDVQDVISAVKDSLVLAPAIAV
ncbi:MAG: DegT/DnrJ/EryC1/StrS family aminotransferase [Thermosynechococcaceae cyanobacterium MS004]|nr:DegT/DnrJ/EryC1/StrS family aminotransferase [Thermosynechococcaceae cyanobacterium MS004]